MTTQSSSAPDANSGRGVVWSLVLLAVLVAAAYAWSGMHSTSRAAGHYTIDMADYAYSPDRMTWHVGERVTLTLRNVSEAHPGKPHEFMMGRVPRKEETPFGLKQEDGFEQSFFQGVDIRVEGGKLLQMLMPGPAHLSGVDPKDLVVAPSSGMQGMGGMESMEGMEHGGHDGMEGFMPVLSPTGDLTFSFTVPDKPGEWTYGCFQESGQHFLNGMSGTVTVLAASG